MGPHFVLSELDIREGPYKADQFTKVQMAVHAGYRSAVDPEGI